MKLEQIEEILENAYIPKELWSECFVTNERMIFTPLFNEFGEIIKNGNIVYKEWLENKDIPPAPNEMEVLNEQVVALEKENKLLKAQVEVLSQTADFHEELIAEMAMQVYA